MKLLLTLGHNASAILIDGSQIIIGYEEERLSYVKADKHFPILAINQILQRYPEARNSVDEIAISHWFWEYRLTNSIYLDLRYLERNFPSANIRSLSKDFTHHDAHAHSLWNFCEGDVSGLTIVADGFGNQGECLSLYEDGRLRHRSYSIDWSLGLMYQYATAYLGLKENQDEFKLLGYEQQKPRLFDIEYANEISQRQIEALSKEGEPIENTESMSKVLSDIRAKWYSILKPMKSDRAAVSQFVQYLLEAAVLHFANKEPKIKVSGGIFYNVKLNNALIRQTTTEHFEASPLSGDQGCALGFEIISYQHLFWGERSFRTHATYPEWFYTLEGPMEFGPRALGNTSAIAKPTLSTVNLLNSLNKRNTVMPMAPIVTEAFAKAEFEDYNKLGKCRHFMIASLDYKNPRNEWLGAAHIDRLRGVYTGRLQVMDEYTNPRVSKAVQDIAINTSLNAHGQPILYDEPSYNLMRRIQNV